MTTRNPVATFGGASNPTQPNSIYIGIVSVKYSDISATVTVPALGNIAIGPCRAIDGLSLTQNGQVLCCFLNGQFDEMVIIGTLSGVWWHSHTLPVASASHTHS